jgi:hypothetical protein
MVRILHFAVIYYLHAICQDRVHNPLGLANKLYGNRVRIWETSVQDRTRGSSELEGRLRILREWKTLYRLANSAEGIENRTESSRLLRHSRSHETFTRQLRRSHGPRDLLPDGTGTLLGVLRSQMSFKCPRICLMDIKLLEDERVELRRRSKAGVPAAGSLSENHRFVQCHMEIAMYRITLACEGVAPELGSAAAIEISAEFTHRQWHQNVRCEWDRTRLLLYAENDWDGTLKLSSMSFQTLLLLASPEALMVASRS